jgi:hypothetical protein
MHAVSIRQGTEFGFTKERFDVKKEWLRYDEDSGVIYLIPVLFNTKIAREWVTHSHSH